jgi:hypothetical protein
MKLSRATIALYVGLVFACGGVLGFFSNRLYYATRVDDTKKAPPTEEEVRKYVINLYTTRLHLTADQVQQMNLILDESKAQINAIHGRMDPEIEAVRQNQITRMNLMLTPEQQPEYEKLRQERLERQKQQQQRRNGGIRPGGPGL